MTVMITVTPVPLYPVCARIFPFLGCLMTRSRPIDLSISIMVTTPLTPMDVF